jgi:ketosteroid isomerase-like protein
MGTNRAEDILDIHQLKSRYFRFMDTKDWARWRQLFTDDLVFYIEDSVFPETTEPTTVGGDAFVEYVSQVLLTAVTVHQGHMPDIEFTGDGEARGIWAMFDWVDDAENGRAMQGFGHYHERYVKGADGRWRIKELRLTRLRVDAIAPSRPEGHRPWPPAWSAPASADQVG